MKTLTELTNETMKALGVNQGLIERYQDLVEKSKHESILNSDMATQYVDDVIQRYLTVQLTQPHNEKLSATKNDYLAQLRQHVAQVSLALFSKPMEISSRLAKVDFTDESIAKVANKIKQPGDDGGDALAGVCLTMLATTETSLAANASNNGCYPHYHPCYY